MANTNTPGIYFEDYAEIAHFTCPEWSHLTPQDAIKFTRSLIKILEQKGWVFPDKKLYHLIVLTSKLYNHGI
ncbi:MAG: hypothetical protein WKF59_18795 [Chitinophagaceae bacterium]